MQQIQRIIFFSIKKTFVKTTFFVIKKKRLFFFLSIGINYCWLVEIILEYHMESIYIYLLCEFI